MISVYLTVATVKVIGCVLTDMLIIHSCVVTPQYLRRWFVFDSSLDQRPSGIPMLKASSGHPTATGAFILYCR